MNFNNLKRKVFFWLEKLQISRKERIAFSLLLGILVILFSLSLFLQHSFQYDQKEYDRIVAEFERRSAAIEQQEAERAEAYTPDAEPEVKPDVISEPDEQIQASEPEISSSDPETRGLININTASSAELQSLDGIGPAYAQNIIEYREANGGFDSIDELINVRGIGEKRLENIRPYITLED